MTQGGTVCPGPRWEPAGRANHSVPGRVGRWGTGLWRAQCAPSSCLLPLSPKAQLVSDIVASDSLDLGTSPSLPPITSPPRITHVLGPEHRLLRALQVPHLQSILLPTCGNHVGARWVLAHPTHPRAHPQFQELKRMEDERGDDSRFQILTPPPAKPSSGSYPGPHLPQPSGSGQGSLTGSEDASLSLSCQTRRIPESTHVMRVLPAKGG